MASSSKCLTPRFYDYLNGLQKEFELRSNATSTSPQRFNIFVGNLKGEFELMALDLESVREERDVYKEKGMYVFCCRGILYSALIMKVEAQAKVLQNVCRNLVCEQCGKTTSAPQVISPSQLKTKRAASSSSSRRHLPRSKVSFRPTKRSLDARFWFESSNPSTPERNNPTLMPHPNPQILILLYFVRPLRLSILIQAQKNQTH